MHGLVIQHGDAKQICQGIFEFDRRLGPLRRKDAQTDRAVRFFSFVRRDKGNREKR